MKIKSMTLYSVDHGNTFTAEVTILVPTKNHPKIDYMTQTVQVPLSNAQISAVLAAIGDPVKMFQQFVTDVVVQQ